MGINVVWQDESGARLAECAATYDDRLGRSVPPERSHRLRYVDPVGDATFNQLQLPQLVRELEEVVASLARLPEARLARCARYSSSCAGASASTPTSASSVTERRVAAV